MRPAGKLPSSPPSHFPPIHLLLHLLISKGGRRPLHRDRDPLPPPPPRPRDVDISHDTLEERNVERHAAAAGVNTRTGIGAIDTGAAFGGDVLSRTLVATQESIPRAVAFGK